MLKKVLLATDGSDSALAATNWVRALAAQVSGLHVTIINIQPIPYGTFGGAVGEAPDVSMASEEWQRVQGERVLDEACHRLESLAHVHKVLVFGRTADVIIRSAKDFDLVIMGAHASNPLARLLRDDLGDAISAKAKVPVLVVPAASPRRSRRHLTVVKSAG